MFSLYVTWKIEKYLEKIFMIFGALIKNLSNYV